jgi:hypothetical protein
MNSQYSGVFSNKYFCCHCEKHLSPEKTKLNKAGKRVCKIHNNKQVRIYPRDVRNRKKKRNRKKLTVS